MLDGQGGYRCGRLLVPGDPAEVLHIRHHGVLPECQEVPHYLQIFGTGVRLDAAPRIAMAAARIMTHVALRFIDVCHAVGAYEWSKKSQTEKI